MALDLKALKDQLIKSGKDKQKVEKAIAYLATNQVAQRHSQSDLYSLITKYINAGTNLDGVNVILSGQNMGLITYNGYLNKVKALHPNVHFDVQIVRETDKFDFKKVNGEIQYNHEFVDTFAGKPIVGAYVVVKLNNESNDQSLELLTREDFEKMKSNSRNQKVWETWESEFWRKSVIKRACKVYFAEEVEVLNAIDNEDYGIEEEVKASDDTKAAILESARANKKQ